MAEAPQDPLMWDQGTPRSALYDDVYYSLQDGLAESRAVFLQGCGLPEAWRGRRHFTVAELGFGTGLNIAALLELWSRTAEADARLHIFSVEAHPIPREDAKRALAAWPELAPYSEPLLARWPTGRRGRVRIDLRWNATLDLAIAEAGEALLGWQGRADAWFLDGFSPALNPAMWREEVLALVAQRSAAGARAATFTVAGHVRRSLAAHGFAVDKRPGHGRKRERLEARLAGTSTDAAPPRIAVVGSGIAGASLARAFRQIGVEATVVAGSLPAASQNPAALVTPALDAAGGPRARLYAEAFARAADLYPGLEDAVIATGAIQVEAAQRDAARFDGIARQDVFDPGSLRRLKSDEVARRLDEPPDAGGLELAKGLVVEPSAILRAWLGETLSADLEVLERIDGAWRLSLSNGQAIEADVVVLAAGWGSAPWVRALSPVRGQASVAEGVHGGPACAFGGYAIPTRNGVLFGATHDRGRSDAAVEAADHLRNLETLGKRRPNLAARLARVPLHGRASIRAATADRMPLAGRLDEGLFVLGGLGSRGFTTAPLLAEHVAALVSGAPSPLAAPEAALIDPGRS
jgi:tRNA 5-methylaminomethyl-2-thiouridine biosynthesis bifunctional protein